ncbi:hypothetical protein [Paenibacillus larvae]|uniref:Uncharacterized protein n=1 Tax=Paenibacillus larvae subsp. larvae TaxID=147375 RepID=A0A2L1U7B7_9BACL|nr:hypothetical protein [Paenibacillus larvae]AVF28827.1 hypothetical protein ERICIII_04823 [Paenibacillus larvae subsp. larvae]MCY9500289.1 hypothetical protein [Paenibacillus larvae]MCY9746963.1 hypothetical protein [Paenibacillus larvae]MCY9752457.1 hypothetical protein [Paenibacillus larvae]MDR5608841.1 hypothetical protein [Paenibacillus larvae]
MLNYVKYIFVGFMVVSIVLTVSYLALNQNANTRTIQEVKSLLSTASTGVLREQQDIQQDPKELVANLVSEVIKVQKNHGNNIRIKYVFLNKDGQPTDGEKMASVQFKIELLDDKQEVRSQAEQRLSLNTVVK